MATTPDKIALQPQGNVCGDCCIVERIQSSRRFQDHSTDRQQDGSFLYTEGRGHKITPTDAIDARIAHSGGLPQCCTNPSPPSRDVQHGSRPTVTKSCRQRVATTSSSSPKNISDLGNTGNRFVSVTNRKRHVSLDSSDSNACYHYAFSRYWRYDLAWVFPPPALLSRDLHHLNSASGRYIITAPKWTKPLWTPDLKNRSLARFLEIRDLKETLVDTKTGLPPARVNYLQLEAWLILAGTPL